jgi:flagellar hook-associated protein 2
MSSQPISNQGLLSSGVSGTGSLLQITGLASNLDTNSIINALMAIDRQPVTALTNEQKGLTALKGQLTSIQGTLQTLSLNAGALGSPALFANSQTVTSSDPTRVSATTSTGAGVGGYQVDVTRLANSAQRTFTYASPASGDSLTIDGKPVTVTAGESIQDFVQSINSDSSQTVYAAAIDNGTVVLSNRATGAPPSGGSFITVADAGGTLTEQAGKARAGQDATYSIDGVPGTSSTNTITGAIGGVTLSLSGVTTTSGPVTVTVTPPGPNSSSIQAAVKTFVDSYNSVIDRVNSQLTQKPVTGDPTTGTLFGDGGLTDLLSSLREAIYTPNANLPAGMASLSDIGVSTGAASGSATFSQDAVNGKLTIDSGKLAAAIANNPTGVAKMLQGFSQSFGAIVDAQAGPGGSLDARIQGETSQISDISNQINNLNAILTERQTALQAQFANLEAALSQSQAQSNWLSSQIASLP